MNAKELADLYRLLKKFFKYTHQMNDCFVDLLSKIFEQGVDAYDGNREKFLDMTNDQHTVNQKQ
jgi:hypothetical protein